VDGFWNDIQFIETFAKTKTRDLMIDDII
jgi:hypothetical protein